MPRPSKANILVVDDEPRSLVAMQQLLSGSDRNVVPVGSGKEALRQILKTQFAIVLLDIRMPEMDGFETVHFGHPDVQQNDRELGFQNLSQRLLSRPDRYHVPVGPGEELLHRD